MFQINIPDLNAITILLCEEMFSDDCQRSVRVSLKIVVVLDWLNKQLNLLNNFKSSYMSDTKFNRNRFSSVGDETW